MKEVVKSIRKGEKGYVGGSLDSTANPRSIIVLAADISPVDILTHLPLLAEEASCPYIVRASCAGTTADRTQWVTSKEALGLASSTKRPTSCVMVAKAGMAKKLKEGETEKEGTKEAEEEFQGLFAEIEKEVSELVRLSSLLSTILTRHSAGRASRILEGECVRIPVHYLIVARI